MNTVLTHLGDLTVDVFLRDYWQRKPWLARQAFPAFESPITPDELAGLALDEDVESRIVIENTANGTWELRRGPFAATDFAHLPATHWTLLVQAVDQWVPEIKKLLKGFQFLPSWRLDDLMVSYAPPGGSVGPHFDYYDVFLIQAAGRRHWHIGDVCDDDSPCLAGTPLRILEHFKSEQDWTLEPGDILYLPAQYAHHGVALEDCLTFSVGFRAPSIAQIMDELATEVISCSKEHQRYCDPLLKSSEPRGEISNKAIDQLKQIISNTLLDDNLLRNWFGRYMTARKYPELDLSAEEITGNWETHLQQGGEFTRHPASRFAFSRNESVELFIDGEAIQVDIAFAELLCSDQPLNNTTLGPLLTNSTNRELVQQLLEYGALIKLDEKNKE